MQAMDLLPLHRFLAAQLHTQALGSNRALSTLTPSSQQTEGTILLLLHLHKVHALGNETDCDHHYIGIWQ